MAISNLFRIFGRKLQRSFPIVLGGNRSKRKPTYIPGLGSVAGYKNHLEFVASRRALSAWAVHGDADLLTRTKAAKHAAGQAISSQTRLALAVLSKRGEIERANIRAKFGVKLAELRLRQAVRYHGPQSGAAFGARDALMHAQKQAIVAGSALARAADVF